VTASSRGHRSGRGIWFDALPAIALAVAGMALTGALIWIQIIEPARAAQSARVAGSAASHYAGLFDARVAELHRHLEAAAGAATTTRALQSGDEPQMTQAARQLAQLLPFTERVDIIPAGTADVDLNADVPISFAALRLIRTAESEGVAGPEGIMLERGSRYFAARAIEADGAAAGVLFVALSADFLLEPLRAIRQHAGRVTLVQAFDGVQPLPLLQWGAASGEQLDAAVRRSLAVPYWYVDFAPERTEPPPPLALVTALAAGFALVLGGIFLSLVGLSRRLRAEAASLPDNADPGPAAGGPAPRPLLADGTAPAAKASKLARSARTSPPGNGSDAAAVAAVAQRDLARDEEVLDVAPAPKDDNFGIEVSEDASPLGLGLHLEPEIFRAYDIRGITTDNLSEAVVYWIGRAFAAEARERDQSRVAVGRDGRHSSAPLRDALIRGLTEGGADVLDVGQVPTPVLYFATHALNTGTGIMITGSHNPPEYNGLKMMIGGETLAEAGIQAIRARIEENRLTEGAGALEQVDVSARYLAEIIEDVVVAQPLKVVVDCGNGVAGRLAPELLAQLGCDVVPLYCDVDGDFPNHHPDPAEPDNLADLITVVAAEGADLGVAFDGDGDRLGVVSGSGRIIWPDRLLMLFAQDIVGRNPGADIIYDVKCSRHLNALIGDLGGRPIMWKTGHSHMKAKLKETKALLAGEFSGHICFGERWYGFDDALYAAARLLEIVGGADESVDDLFGRFPITFSTPEIKVPTSEQAKFAIIDRLARAGDFGAGTITTIDGLRVDFVDGWGLIRASNTSPVLTLRFEADDEAALDRIQALFQQQLSAIDQQLRFR
jgi:phosphomannomutase / phosphoglucomutase